MKKVALLSGLAVVLIVALTLSCGKAIKECIDNDGDGYGEHCDLGPDCNDSDPSINPGASEIPFNERDDNCDGDYHPDVIGVSHRDTSGSSRGVYVTGEYAYVADGESGLAIIDVSNPARPGAPVYRDTSDRSRGVYVIGGYAYVADEETGLAIIDVTDPTSPGTPIYQDTSGNPGGTWRSAGVYATGEYAYVASLRFGMGTIYDGGLAIVNISDPASPGTPVFEAIPWGSAGVYVTEGYAYVAGLMLDVGFIYDDGSLVIIDVSDPTEPGTPIYRDTSWSNTGVYVTGNYAYMAGVKGGSESSDGGLAIVDVSDPTEPGTPVYRDTGVSAGVYVSGDYAYMACLESGLAIIDVSDPANPGTPVYRDTDGRSLGVYVTGDYVYVADWENGLVIFKIW